MPAVAAHAASSSGASAPRALLKRAVERELGRAGVVELAARHLPDLARAHARAFPRGGAIGGAVGLKALAVVAGEPGLTAREIAERLGMSKAAVVRALADLREGEMIKTTPGLAATERGRAELHAHVERVLAQGEFSTTEGWAELEALVGCRAASLLRRRLRERGIEPPV